jgi:hypothetical protein
MRHPPVRYTEIGKGDSGIFMTVNEMGKLINRSLGNQHVRQKAERLIREVTPNDMNQEAENIYNFVRDGVRFTKDPRGLEYVQSPGHILDILKKEGKAYGDCDDKTVLGLALLKNVGHQVAVKTTSYSPNGKFTHVYGLVKLNGRWVPFDTTRPDKWLGWEAPGVTRAKEYKLDGHGNLGEINWDSVMEEAIGSTVGAVVTILTLIFLGLRK